MIPKATTVRFTDEMFARLDQASARTGMPVNSIVIAACLEWMQRHTPQPAPAPESPLQAAAGIHPPRWATIRRAVELAAGRRGRRQYPFERFTDHAQKMLTLAQAETQKAGHGFIGTEHLLLAAFQDPDFDAARVLAVLGLTESAARARIDELLKGSRSRRPPRMIPTSRVKRVIELAFDLCSERGDPRVGTGHILLGLAIEGEGIAAHVLTDLGATRERIESALEGLTEPEA